MPDKPQDKKPVVWDEDGFAECPDCIDGIIPGTRNKCRRCGGFAYLEKGVAE